MRNPKLCLPPVEQTQHHPFTKLRRQRRDPHVKLVTADAQLALRVLRLCASDIELAHHLEAAGF